MSWIKTIDYEHADAKLKQIYDKIKAPDNNIDNVLLVHSLRPHSLTGHMHLYKNVLHHANNTLARWYIEAIGIYVSHLNHCTYCFDHHYAGIKRHLHDIDQAERLRIAIVENQLEDYFNDQQLEGCRYAKKLTCQPEAIKQEDIQALRKLGFSDGEILEINQITSYFNYVNRTVIGLGVNTIGDMLGLSPNDINNQDDWTHQ